MDMQDKEFDHLFNSKLDNFEIEPSPMVWENIASELHGKKAKRSIMPYISIAASVIILISVGLLLFNQIEETFVKPIKRGKVVVKITKPETFDDTAKSIVVTASEITKAPTNEVVTVSKQMVFIAPKVVIDDPVNQITTKTNDQVIADPITINQPALAVVAPLQKEPVMVVPGKETSFAAAPADKQQVIETTTTEETSTEIMKTPVKKRGIHSLGGLIGALVAKVDKREDKLIEFTESDESGSTITGLNLGLIKIKKQ
jgi:hypothetical protein